MWRASINSSGLRLQRPLIIITGPSTGAVSGVATHVNLLLQSAVRQRFALEHFCVGGEGQVEGAASRMLRHLRTPLHLLAMLMIERPALVHINTSLNARALPRDAALLFVAWLLRCPVVWQVHGGRSLLELAHPMALAVLKMLLKVPRRVVVLTRQDELGYAKVVDARRLQRISNAVPVVPASAALADERRPPGLRVTYMGRLVAGKGVLDLIEAMRIIARAHAAMPISLTIVGAGPLAEQLRAAASEADLCKHVQVSGPVMGAAKHQLLSQTDVFALPTTFTERLPYALLETMAAGIPAVACGLGGVTEVIQDRRTGLLVLPGRPDLLAAAVLELARDRQLLEQMSRAARERISDSYDLAQMAARFCALYEEVLDERRRA
jgi:glycosyltransferase involved in cell wall biosynthesis